MKNGEYEGKTIVFNPAGFILKMILFIAAIIFMATHTTQEYIAAKGGIIYTIFDYAMQALAIYFIATLFGFCLRATGNYIIAFILMLILLVLLGIALEWIDGKSQILSVIVSVACVAAWIWLPINDVRKAILYYKNTI